MFGCKAHLYWENAMWFLFGIPKVCSLRSRFQLSCVQTVLKNLYLILSKIKAYVVLFPKSCMATLQDVLVSNTIKVWKHRMTEKESL